MKTGYFEQAQEVGFYLSNAKISLMLDSPGKYFARYGEGFKKEPTQAMIRGRMLHDAILRPDEFAAKCHTHTFKDFRTKAAQDWRSSILEKDPEAYILDAEGKEEIQRVVDSVYADPLVADLLKEGLNERFGYAELSGISALSRPDLVTKRGIIADLKIVRSVDAVKFNRQAFYEDWYIQLGFYNTVHGLISGRHSNQNACFIAVEAEYPHKVKVFTLSAKYEEMAETKIMKGIELIKMFMEKDPEFKNKRLWMEYDSGVVELEPTYGFISGDSDFSELIEL